MIDFDIRLNSLTALLGNIRHYSALSEANTKSSIIVPILHELQWNVRSPFEVVREFALDSGTVDYALKIIDTVKVLIEVKKIGENLQFYEKQIKKYALNNNTYLFILSDGLKWQFYTWLEEGIEIFKFHYLDIKTQDLQFVAKELINILSKESIFSNNSYNYIRNIIQKDPYKFALYEEITKIWHKILDEPHHLLCDLIIDLVEKSFGRSPEIQDVKKVLSTYNSEFNKIRGTFTIGESSETINKLMYYEEIVIKCIKRLHKLKDIEWIKNRDIAMRVHHHMNSKQLDQILDNLKEKGFIQIEGKVNIKLMDHTDNL